MVAPAVITKMDIKEFYYNHKSCCIRTLLFTFCYCFCYFIFIYIIIAIITHDNKDKEETVGGRTNPNRQFSSI